MALILETVGVSGKVIVIMVLEIKCVHIQGRKFRVLNSLG